MMDISEKGLASVYDEIKNKLSINGFSNRALELDNSAVSASTGSEAVCLQGKYLIDLEMTDSVAFNLVKEEIADFIQLCKKVGLFIR
jgi:hypothetical protein